MDLATMMAMLLPMAAGSHDGWVHPAGLIDRATLSEVRHKRETQDWARKILAGLDQGVQPWLAEPREDLEARMPRRRMGVYWLLLCPECGRQLRFDPFDDRQATCVPCGKTYPLTEQSTAAPPGSRYAGTLYDGWGCYYLQHLARTAQELAFLHALGADRSYAIRAAEVLRLFACRTRQLPVAGSGPFRMIWTYAYEGDYGLLTSLVTAYELLRGVDGLLTAEDHEAIRQDLLKHWVDSVFRVEVDHSQRHNNTYGYLTAVALVGCAIEDVDYVDWAYGQRKYAASVRPDHRSLAWLADHNYLDDGAFWGLSSAYHLYAIGPHCRAMLLGAKLSRQMPDLFPPELYDEMAASNPRGRTARRAIKWFTAQTLPDLTMAPFGDMGGRVSLATYPLTAEIGYRYLGIEEVGHYPRFRQGSRSLAGLLYGADTIEPKPHSHPSALLSSGYAALRRPTKNNHLYAGLNALVPGSSHSHGDRLNLITYSRDRLLAGEKRTLYTNPQQRTYSGASYGHNTVTVDETSQEHGNRLSGERVPHIRTFVDLPVFQAVEARGDKVYATTKIYRRLVCQFDEYLVDLFRVEGGKTHDWFHHGIGGEPVVSIPMKREVGFEPARYVVGGERAYRTGETSDPFTVTWTIPAEKSADYAGRGRDVHSRVTLAGQLGQRVNVLSTYPDPGRHSLMVRHAGPSSLFAAVHEAYFDAPVAEAVNTIKSPRCRAFEIHHRAGGRRIVMYEGDSADGDPSLDGLLGVVHVDPDGRITGLGLLRGTALHYRGVVLQTDEESCLSVSFMDDRVELVSSPGIAYRTVEGQPMFLRGADLTARISVPAEASHTGTALDLRVEVPGQADEGLRPVDLRQ